MYYAVPSGGNILMVAVPANQASRPIYIAGQHSQLNISEGQK